MSISIGVIFCGYGTRDLVEQSLAPWVELRNLCMQQFDRRMSVSICAVSVKFAGFEGEDDGTREYLRGALERRDIDHLIDSPDGMKETEARGRALIKLDGDGVDLLWLVDSDEFYQREEIDKILAFVAANEWTAWFRLSLKNYVLNERTYLADPFQPPRIFRTRVDGYKTHSFSGDNDIVYGGTITRDLLHQDRFPSMTIPKEYAWIKHLSWMSDERGKKKTEYQWRRWGSACSFSWDDAQGGLIFNPALPAPKIVRE